MSSSVGEVGKPPIPIRPHPGITWSEIESSPKLAKVRARIWKWAGPYNLTGPWILETVVQTLLSWTYIPEYQGPGELRWAHAGHFAPIFPKDLRFRPDTTFGFDSDAEIRLKVSEQLDAYLQERKEYHSSLGYDPEAVGKHTAEHYKCFALYHTNAPSEGTRGKPLSAEQIGSKFGFSKGYVEKLCNELYEFLDLDPKEGSRGRKRGTSATGQQNV
jgi:hypothetical protein